MPRTVTISSRIGEAIFLPLTTMKSLAPPRSSRSSVRKPASRWRYQAMLPTGSCTNRSRSYDLDLFVQDPVGHIAWYRHREAGFLTLDRDDRGGANDFIVVNGKKIASPIREEIVTVRGIVPGEYTVNVSHFVATTGEPVTANVKVQKLNPTAQVVFDNKFTVDHTGDEKTAVRFRLDAEGKVVNVDQRPKSLLETFRSGWRNGADLDPSTGVSKNAVRVRRD